MTSKRGFPKLLPGVPFEDGFSAPKRRPSQGFSSIYWFRATRQSKTCRPEGVVLFIVMLAGVPVVHEREQFFLEYSNATCLNEKASYRTAVPRPAL